MGKPITKNPSTLTFTKYSDKTIEAIRQSDYGVYVTQSNFKGYPIKFINLVDVINNGADIVVQSCADFNPSLSTTVSWTVNTMNAQNGISVDTVTGTLLHGSNWSSDVLALIAQGEWQAFTNIADKDRFEITIPDKNLVLKVGLGMPQGGIVLPLLESHIDRVPHAPLTTYTNPITGTSIVNTSEVPPIGSKIIVERLGNIYRMTLPTNIYATPIDFDMTELLQELPNVQLYIGAISNYMDGYYTNQGTDTKYYDWIPMLTVTHAKV